MFEAYLEHRVEPVTGALEPEMYAGCFDWSDCLKPTAARPYIKITLMSVIAIHAEVSKSRENSSLVIGLLIPISIDCLQVYTVCPLLVPRVLSEVIRSISEELNRLIHCITKISVNGSLQARLDIDAFRQATIAFSTPQSE